MPASTALEGQTDENTSEPRPRLGRYELVRRLARGGMAELFLARATGTAGFEKRVVIKRVLPGFSQTQEWVSMFLDEARLTAALSHPNIAQVYDLGYDGESYYFVMEYLEGEDVRALVRHCRNTGQSLPLSVVLTIVAGAAAGLHAAHVARGPTGKALGIVHRDVSPSNVFVSFDGTVKVLDFGVAKAFGRITETRVGIRKGKVAYMSPEQVLGRELDGRSDVFALGVLLYELTVGHRLFTGDTDVAIARQIVDGPIVPPAERVDGYSPELSALIMKALARNSKERFASARELQLAIEQFAGKQRTPLSSARLALFMDETYRDKLTFLKLVGPTEIPSAPIDAPEVMISASAWSVLVEAESTATSSQTDAEAPADSRVRSSIGRRASEMGKQAVRKVEPWVIPLVCAMASAAFTAWLLSG